MAKDLLSQIKEQLPDFLDEVKELNLTQINARLSKLCQDAEDTRQARDDDDELSRAREKATCLGAPYRETLKAIGLKTRYLVQQLKEKGL